MGFHRHQNYVQAAFFLGIVVHGARRNFKENFISWVHYNAL